MACFGAYHPLEMPQSLGLFLPQASHDHDNHAASKILRLVSLNATKGKAFFCFLITWSTRARSNHRFQVLAVLYLTHPCTRFRSAHQYICHQYCRELRELPGEKMWKSCTDRMCWQPVLSCPVLSAKTRACLTRLSIADCAKSLAGCVQLFLGCPEVIVAYVLLEHQKTQSIANALRTHSTTYVNIAALTYVDRILFTVVWE